MCGIVGAVARRQVAGILLEGLDRLEYRGYDSAGIAVIEQSGAVARRRAVGKVAELKAAVAGMGAEGTTGIAHTRWATHGVPSEANAHPQMSGDKLALVHNGIIENHHDLRDRLMALGYEFSSQTDTETIVHLVDYHYREQRDLLEAVRASLGELDGAYAIAVVHEDYPDQLVAARKGSPLVVGVGIGEHYVASDVLALRPVTDRFIFLEDGDLVSISRDGYRIWDVDNLMAQRAVVRVRMGEEDTGRGDFRHYMAKEIHQQPAVIRRTLEGRLGHDRVLEPAFGFSAGEVFDAARNVTIVACGSSYYAASVARYWIEALSGMPCNVEIASEYRYREVAVPASSLFVTISQSGETADTLAALQLAKRSGYLSSLTLCNVPTSTIVRESDLALMTEAGPEIGVASTKAFTAQLTDLLLLSVLLGRRGNMSARQERDIVEALHELPRVVEDVLKLEPMITRLAEHFIEKSHALFLGRGEGFPIALEGALKLKEISYIHAEGYPAGELKHGPLALVDSDMPVIAVASNDDLLEKLQSNLQEVRARGGQLFVFADAAVRFREEPDVQVVRLPPANRFVAPIVQTVALQLLAYHVAVLRGTDVDQPRNLAKSVTVE